MAKRISEKEKKEIIDDFTKNKTLDEISEKFNFTKVTITRHLKKSLGQEEYSKLVKLNKNEKKYAELQYFNEDKTASNNLEILPDETISNESFQENTFLEIAPLNLEIDNKPQKDLSSISIEEVELPKVVYMVVDKQVELETKLLKEYVEWNFLSEEDLSRNTIEIFYDLKNAKRSTKKDHRYLQ